MVVAVPVARLPLLMSTRWPILSSCRLADHARSEEVRVSPALGSGTYVGSMLAAMGEMALVGMVAVGEDLGCTARRW